jgi:serine O-acetyltransferase
MKLIESIREDLRAHRGDWFAQGFWAFAVHRFGEWRYQIRWSPLRKGMSFVYRVLYKMVQIITGIEFPCEATVGRGTRIDHFGGIVISGYAVIGDYCVIRQGVTIGLKNETEPCGPRIGNHVSIGAGAKILGNVRIGDHVDIGANAVVLSDVPPHSVAVGIPARIIPRKTSTIPTHPKEPNSALAR